MELQGKIEAIRKGLGNEAFEKNEIILETHEQYPQFVSIEFGGTKADLIDPYKIGDSVKISINIRGKKYTNKDGELKYFNSIVGWKIEKL